MCIILDDLLKSLNEARKEKDWNYAKELCNTMKMVCDDKCIQIQCDSIKKNLPEVADER